MCFSAGASFIAGGTLSVAGGFTILKAKNKRELPFASIPLLFGIQQTIEGVIWLSFHSPPLNTVMTYAYSIFSHVLWPILVPFSIFLIENNKLRKKILLAFSFTGLITGLYLLYFIFTEPISSRIIQNSISYQSITYYSPHFYPFLTMALYVCATSVSCLFSSHKIINIFGITVFISFFIAYWFFYTTFFSVWCFFAAILSYIIYLYFTTRNKKNHSR